MTPIVYTDILTTGGTLTLTVNDSGAALALLGDGTSPDFTIGLSPVQSRNMANAWDAAEDQRDLDNLIALQSDFETEMGAELIAYNSQALVKDADRNYVQSVTRLSFDAYQKGLDGPPV